MPDPEGGHEGHQSDRTNLNKRRSGFVPEHVGRTDPAGADATTSRRISLVSGVTWGKPFHESLGSPSPVSAPAPDPKRLMRMARVAGLWYLLTVVTGPFTFLGTSGLVVSGDPAATASNILASESYVRFVMVMELIAATGSIFVVLALYRLLNGVDRDLARLMVILGAVVSVPIYFLNVLSELMALSLATGGTPLSAFTKPQLDALAYLFLNLHAQGNYVATIFAGLWLFPFGLLVWRSGFFPRILGVVMFANGLAYLVASATFLVLPGSIGAVTPIAMVFEVGELVMTGWLLVMGAKVRPSAAPAA